MWGGKYKHDRGMGARRQPGKRRETLTDAQTLSLNTGFYHRGDAQVSWSSCERTRVKRQVTPAYLSLAACDRPDFTAVSLSCDSLQPGEVVKGGSVE